MKVFISWSGTRSRQLADEFRGWLPRVLQASQPWMSDVDINSGSRWAASIAKELADANFGIICITRENMHNPWLLFEAGALSKAISESHVCPLLLGFGPSEIDGPLSQFQASPTNSNGVFNILSAINRTMPKPLDDSALTEIFEVWWPRLETKIAAIPTTTEQPSPKRTTDQVLADLLELSREHMRRDNLRIEHQKERDKQLDKLHAVMDGLQKAASHALDVQSGPLALISQIEGKMNPRIGQDLDKEITPSDLAQMTKIAKEIAKSAVEKSPLQAIADFKSISKTIDAHDQQLYANLLEPPKSTPTNKESDTKN